MEFFPLAEDSQSLVLSNTESLVAVKKEKARCIPLKVPFHMQCEVVRSGKRSVTPLALEGAMAGMFSVVACEFIGSGKLPATAFPVTVVGLLTFVNKTAI